MDQMSQFTRHADHCARVHEGEIAEGEYNVREESVFSGVNDKEKYHWMRNDAIRKGIKGKGLA